MVEETEVVELCATTYSVEARLTDTRCCGDTFQATANKV